MPQRKSIAAPESFLTFGDLLVYLRKRARLTQEELGRAVGYSRSQITLLEKNQRLPSATTVTALFVPALDLDDAPALAQRLMDLAASARKPRTNLPAPVNALIGRERDAARVRDYFLAPDKRLVTLIGPPGIGKTRLSLQVADDLLADFADGVFFVALAPVTNPDLVAPTVAQTLGFPELSGIPAEERLRTGIGQRQILLVLDNFEQIVDGAAPLALDLLTTCPHLKLLVTSRESLRVPGEWLYPVPPLLLPDESQRKNLTIEEAEHYSALRLFAERARAVRPDFSLSPDNLPAVAAICQRLDGLALAIELIAARLRLLSPQTLLTEMTESFTLHADGMRGVPMRQKTLHNAIDWSYALLSPDEQALLRGLAVCVGGSTLEAAQAITPAPQLITKITSLLDKSLLSRSVDPGGEVRYSLLVMIRDFALDRLREQGAEAEQNDRHAAYFLDLAERADRAMHGPHQAAWMDRLEIEHANIRAALAWVVDRQQTETALRLLGALAWPWRVRGYIGELRSWFDKIRALPDVEQYAAAYVKVLNGLGRAMWLIGNNAEARSFLRESQRLGMTLGSAGTAGLAEAIGFQGTVAMFGYNDLATAQPFFEQANDLYRQCGDQWGLAEGLLYLGQGAMMRGESAAARSWFEQSLALFRSIDDPWGTGRVYTGWGDLLFQEADYAQARAMHEQTLAISRELKFKQGIADDLFDLSLICLHEGDFEKALQCCEESVAVSREFGLSLNEALAVNLRGYLALQRDDYALAKTCFGESLAFYRHGNPNFDLVECLAGLAAVAAGLKQSERAAQLWGAAQAMLKTLDVELDSFMRSETERHLGRARDQLGKLRYEAALAEGRALSSEEVIYKALVWSI